MTRAISSDLYGDLVDAAARPGFSDWLGMVRATGGCAEPIHLWGESSTIHLPTGEILSHRPIGQLLVACGNRRRTRCLSCSETYRADTYQLIKAGLVGGKNVPETVAGHPKVFATFTAPSFGAVHHRVVRDDGSTGVCRRFGPCQCPERHQAGDPQIGQPLDPANYDYVGAVIWNALATRLWARTVKLVNRRVATLVGVRHRDWARTGRVSVAKVAEYQARGLVHFHAIFRLDGADPGDPPPAGASVDLLCRAIREAASVAAVELPDCAALARCRPIKWGEQLELRAVTPDGSEGPLADCQVAGYIAKYATKGAEAAGTIDRPLACRNCKGLGRQQDRAGPCGDCRGTGRRPGPDVVGVSDHCQAMLDTCWQLGALEELEELRLRPWAHMLGFRGHFSTKSRRYSTTLGCLREARKRWRELRTLEAHGIEQSTTVRRTSGEELADMALSEPPEDTVLVVGSWHFTGRGHSPGEAIFAAAVRNDLAEARWIGRYLRESDE